MPSKPEISSTSSPRPNRTSILALQRWVDTVVVVEAEAMVAEVVTEVVEAAAAILPPTLLPSVAADGRQAYI